MNQSINDEAVYRTAPATPGLLITNSKESEAGISEDAKKVKVSLSVKKMKVKLKKAITKKNTSGKKIMDCGFCDYSCKKQLT